MQPLESTESSWHAATLIDIFDRSSAKGGLLVELVMLVHAEASEAYRERLAR